MYIIFSVSVNFSSGKHGLFKLRVAGFFSMRLKKQKSCEISCKISQLLFRDPCRIQTCNLLIRSQILYSVELRGRSQTRLQRYIFLHINTMTDIIFFIIFLILEVKHSGRLVSKTVFFSGERKKSLNQKIKSVSLPPINYLQTIKRKRYFL